MRPSHNVASSTLGGGKATTGHWQEGFKNTCGKCGAVRIDNQIGLEATPDAFIAALVEVFRGVKRVLRNDGTLWIVIGDSYAGSWGNYSGHNRGKGGQRAITVRSLPLPAWEGREQERPAASRPLPGIKNKDLLGIPWMLAFALRSDGWWLRSAITWCKGNPLPESVQDRPSQATEMLFLFSKNQRYFYDIDATRVVAQRLNRGRSADEVGLEVGRATAQGFAAKGGKIALNDQWTPYLILASLLGMKRVFVKERNDLLGKCFDILKRPQHARICWPILTTAANGAPQMLMDILEHIGIVITELDSDTEAEFWVRLASDPATMKGNNGAFAVKQPREVIAKIIANAQLIRHTVPLDALTKGLIDVDVIEKTIPLFECIDLDAGSLGDGLITEALLEQFRLAVRGSGLQELGSPCHTSLTSDGDYASNYTTEAPTRNLWNWWVVNTQPFSGDHHATFPEKLIEPCILAGSRPGDTVLDPFLGSGTTGKVSLRLGRKCIGIELSQDYIDQALDRTNGVQTMLDVW